MLRMAVHCPTCKKRNSTLMANSTVTQAEPELPSLVDGYWDWLRQQTKLREVGDWMEITTPYLDHHNDRLQIYARRDSDGWLLTDDGHVIDDLAQSGCEVKSPKGQHMMKCAIAAFGVCLEDGALVVKTSATDFALRKHNLVQAMLSVGSLFHTMESGGSSSAPQTMRYTVVIERAPRNFSAYVPDLPGCIATGATKEEVVREIRDAISFHIDGLREHGDPVPPSQSTAAVVDVAAG